MMMVVVIIIINFFIVIDVDVCDGWLLYLYRLSSPLLLAVALLLPNHLNREGSSSRPRR